MIGWIGILVVKIELDGMEFQARGVAVVDEVDPFLHLLRNEYVFRIAVGVGKATVATGIRV